MTKIDDKNTLVWFVHENSSRLTALALFFTFIVLFIDFGNFSGKSQIIMVFVSDLLFVIVGLTVIMSYSKKDKWSVMLFRYILLFFIFSFAWMAFNKTLENIEPICHNQIVRTNAWGFLIGAGACFIYSIKNIIKQTSSKTFNKNNRRLFVVNLIVLISMIIFIGFLVFYVGSCLSHENCEHGYVEYPNSFYGTSTDGKKMTNLSCKSGCYEYYRLTEYEFENNTCLCVLKKCERKKAVLNEESIFNIFKICPTKF